jgi:hypothetical protein
MYSAHNFNIELSHLRDTWDQCDEGEGRFAFYKYLEEVYRLYADLRANDAAQWSVEQIVQQFDKKPKYQNHLIRMIIDVTCSADRKTKVFGRELCGSLGVNAVIGRTSALSFGEMAGRRAALNNSRKLGQRGVAIVITRGRLLVQFLRIN